ncbi:MAG: UDP-N-acetylglucosamine 2-epimerase (non-hydrolyzing) [Anaerolineales bacterium]|nr:UDP-N-acetylglucosamine 2-epimerase (non-hydrolyzing) [Anaerolineales bacterium]
MTSQKPVIHLIAAARPNFMKIAPVYHELVRQGWCETLIVHTGQHYDANMSDTFFSDLKLPDPHIHLHVGSGTHAEQTAQVMMAYEKVCLAAKPDWTIVVGDVNSTMACTITAKKMHISVAHLEAGLRSWDMSMPEEINRILTDSISDLCWTPSPDGDENLLKTGISPQKIVRVGNIMLDSYEMMRSRIEAEHTPQDLGLTSGEYGVVTLHRDFNVDNLENLRGITQALSTCAKRIPLVFPVHPRTHKRLEEFGFLKDVRAIPNLYLVEPMGYIPFMNLVQQSRFVVTDSGGIQEETTYLDIPCITVRPNTERPITITQGTNRLVKIEEIAPSVNQVLDGVWPSGIRPDLWDGNTAERVAESLHKAIFPDKGP